ncbi:MAG: aminodeoxychorismate/anthranilate synthase component II [bacterium]|nr:aminodeoxychorismate/anthranilate synthase component II [bacterium]
MLLMIDNYDSFAYNLVQYFGELGTGVSIYRNDRITPDEAEAIQPEHLVISPGPCSPEEAGMSNDMIRRFAGKIPILGVCLGHQCIGHVFGGNIVRAARLMHGKTSPIGHDGQGLFAGQPQPFEAIRYHSLAISDQDFPAELEVTARSDDGEIMGVRHRRYCIEGVQFHPESIMTQEGKRLLANFLEMGGGER